MRQLTNEAGEITLAKRNEPDGELRSTSGGGASPFAFTGEQVDESTGLVYLRARYYASREGRFLSRDIFGRVYIDPSTFNRWAYAHNNPVLLTDASGQCDPLCILAILIATGILVGCSSTDGTPVATPANEIELIQLYIDIRKFQEAIDQAITTYSIDTRNVNGKVTWAGPGPLGYLASTNPSRNIKIYNGAFYPLDIDISPGLLGAIIDHETIHANQISGKRHYSQIPDEKADLQDAQYNINEVEAYKWVLSREATYRFSNKEKNWIQDNLQPYYDALSAKDKSRVDGDDYEIP